MLYDALGRYVVMSGEWEGMNINLCSVYLPLGLQSEMLVSLGILLLRLPKGRLVMGGDMNDIVPPDLDALSRTQGGLVTTRQGGLLRGFLEALGLVDIWRHQNPTARQYTHVSAGSGSLSRIDYVLIQTVGFGELGRLST